MVNCISQLILLAHAGRIGRLPSLDTIENAMKLSPLVVQALWDKASPLMQLPHIEEDMLKHFHSRKRNIKTLQQLAKMKVENLGGAVFFPCKGRCQSQSNIDSPSHSVIYQEGFI